MDRRKARQASRLAGGGETDRAELPAGRSEAAGITARGRLRMRATARDDLWLVGRAGCGAVTLGLVPRAPRMRRTQGRQACCSKNAQEKFCAPDARKGCPRWGLP